VRKDGSIKIHLFLLLVVTAVFIWSAIKPASYLTWALEVSPAVVGLIIVIAAYNKFRFTTLSYVIISFRLFLQLTFGDPAPMLEEVSFG
jgi:putative membrane protein